jgi:hypothetical protein
MHCDGAINDCLANAHARVTKFLHFFLANPKRRRYDFAPHDVGP